VTRLTGKLWLPSCNHDYANMCVWAMVPRVASVFPRVFLIASGRLGVIATTVPFAAGRPRQRAVPQSSTSYVRTSYERQNVREVRAKFFPRKPACPKQYRPMPIFQAQLCLKFDQASIAFKFG
jgi:hypothetical protein